MCECLCGELKGDVVFHVLNNTATLVVDTYRGCKNCAQVIGIDIRAFNVKGCNDWLDGNRGKLVTPDEYGGVPTSISYELFRVDDLAKALASTNFPPPEGYDDWEDFMSDHGLRAIQAAMSAADKRRSQRAKGEI